MAIQRQLMESGVIIHDAALSTFNTPSLMEYELYSLPRARFRTTSFFMTFRRFDIKTEIFLVLMPTTVVIAVLMLLEVFSKQQLLFSSLASSAFLIYLDPRHPVNHVRTLVISQIASAVLGYLVYLLLGPGYPSAAVSMILTIAVMIAVRAMHPPAVSTAMIFAFQFTGVNTLMLFLFAVILLVILIFLQRVSIWLIKRSEGKKVLLEEELSDAITSKSLNRNR